MLQCFHGILGPEQKWNAPLYNRFVHGVRDTAMSQGIMSMEEAGLVENQADKNFDDEKSIDEKELVQLPPEDQLSTCSYKRHVLKAIMSRVLCLLCGVLIGYLLPLCFR